MNDTFTIILGIVFAAAVVVPIALMFRAILKSKQANDSATGNGNSPESGEVVTEGNRS